MSSAAPHRLGRLAVVLCALALGLVATPSAQARIRPAAPKPTVVLVHGANAGTSSWHGVVVRLQKAGYRAIAFANPLRSVAGDSAYLSALLAAIKGKIVLVGHSYGGMLISVAAAGNPKVKSLVYIDAQIPVPGETAGELTTRFPGSQYGKALVPVPFSLPGGVTGTDLYVAPRKYRSLFTGPAVSAAEARAQAAAQRPVAESALSEPATAAAWRRIPSWAIIGTKDKAIPPAAQRFMARRAKAHIVSIPAPHASMLTFAGAEARVIKAAAR